jgi:DNA-binding transcriptional MerR regulator
MMMMRSYTARELARQIAASGADEQPIFERIRHWTRMGLITTLGEENPGSGRSREYPSPEIRKVRLLNILADFGVSVATMKEVVRVFENDPSNKSGPAAFAKELGGQGMATMLFVEKSSGRAKPYIRVIADDPSDDSIKVTIARDVGAVLMINLSRLL